MQLLFYRQWVPLFTNIPETCLNPRDQGEGGGGYWFGFVCHSVILSEILVFLVTRHFCCDSVTLELTFFRGKTLRLGMDTFYPLTLALEFGLLFEYFNLFNNFSIAVYQVHPEHCIYLCLDTPRKKCCTVLLLV